MEVFLAPAFHAYFAERPLTLVDIGARGGIPKHWRQARAFLRTIIFEPDTPAYNKLVRQANPNTIPLQIGVYSHKGNVDFYITAEGGDSSLLVPNEQWLARFPSPERYAVVNQTLIQVDTLDNILSEHQIRGVDFIKLDIQGAELFALQGARQTLQDQVLGVEMEVEFAPLYQNQPLFADVHTFLQPFGLELFDLRPIYWKRRGHNASPQRKGQIIYGDALYLASLERVNQLIAARNAAERKHVVLHLIAICLVYGYLDYAAEIVENFGDLFSTAEREILADALAYPIVTPSSSPTGKAAIVRALQRLLRRLDPPPPPTFRFFGSGTYLGNTDSN